MEKKTKMWVAVGVVVMVIAGGTLYYLLKPSGTDGCEASVYYSVSLEVSETDVAWYVNITKISGKKVTKGFLWDTTEEIENPVIHANEIVIVIKRSYPTGRYYINIGGDILWADMYSEKHGVLWVNEYNDFYVREGNTFIFFKEGGTEFRSQVGDEIFFDRSRGYVHACIYIESNTVRLP